MKQSVKLPKHYQNNPFFVATDGLDVLFKKAQSVGIAFAILSGIALLGSLPTYFLPNGSEPAHQNQSVQTGGGESFNAPVEFFVVLGVIALVFILIFTFIGIVIRGVSDYAAAQLANGKSTTLGEALRAVFANFWSYTWMLIVLGVKTFLWTLLFIIPGFIMAVRYSLAGVSFFDKKLKGGAASKHSADVTKGAWLTTFASQTLLNIITFGAIQPLLTPGTNGVLYQQLVKVKLGDAKPKAHILSWLTLIIPILMTVLIGAGIFFLIWAAVNYTNVAS